ncbi:hypothetical protein K3495_g12792 [Podosphaera aphanis]|nr:hypothetical protein K3495_g12792 [Podosphaera aphanis]
MRTYLFMISALLLLSTYVSSIRTGYDAASSPGLGAASMKNQGVSMQCGQIFYRPEQIKLDVRKLCLKNKRERGRRRHRINKGVKNFRQGQLPKSIQKLYPPTYTGWLLSSKANLSSIPFVLFMSPTNSSKQSPNIWLSQMRTVTM